MARRKADIDKPHWPRLMGRDLAAAYFDLSPGSFDALGIPRRQVGARILYDRQDLDQFADRLHTGKPSGLVRRAAG